VATRSKTHRLVTELLEKKHVIEQLAMKTLSGLHLVGAGTFVSAAVFLDFAVLPSMRYIPPDQGTKLAREIEPKIILVSTLALGLLLMTGLLEVTLHGAWGKLLGAEFWGTGQSFPVIVCLLIWVLMAVSQGLYIRVFRPHLPQALPFDVSRTVLGISPETSRITELARWTLRFQAILGLTAILLVAGSARYGGL
jgi:hypothetical protein